MTTLKVALCLTAMLTALPASAATLPASAKKATMDEFKALADGKAVTVPVSAARTLDFHRASELIALGTKLTAQALDDAGY